MEERQDSHGGFLSARPVRAATTDNAKELIYNRLFLSARPVRAATPRGSGMAITPLFLSARPVRAATSLQVAQPAAVPVSIRATRAGRDPLASVFVSPIVAFLSARPVRAATA